MCGICGVYNFNGEPVEATLLSRMKAAMTHRGPDGDGSFFDREMALGHRRLSIIDLGGGAQPIGNEDGSVQVVFNGEIYNYIELRKELLGHGHVFKTQSDTEVIVHAYEQWGAECVSRFNGMFAFALWDVRRRTLVLARDHLGIKPLYYATVGSRLIFASEIKALLQDSACPREVDLSSLSQLFTLRYVPSPATLFNGIRKLPPAHVAVVTANGLRISRYWNWKPGEAKPIQEAEAVETYRSLVEDAVKLQMRSDVPVGLFLSSGVDSAGLLALMSKDSNRPVHTFTIGFEDGGRKNETDGARKLAQQFGADHSEMVVTAKDYLDYYERYLRDLEEPVGNESAAAFYFVSNLARKKVKVALTGQGADEPWAGYGRHLGVSMSRFYSRLPLAVTGHMIRPLVEKFVRNEQIRRGVLALDEREPLNRLIKVYSFYSPAMKRGLFQPWVQEQVSVEGEEAREALRPLYEDVEERDALTQILYMDTRTNLPDDLLMVGDKTSMANSVEARLPFLDVRLVEFAESLPARLRLNGTKAKYVHKKAMEKWLPHSVVHASKKGFSNPVDQWLRGAMKGYVQDMVLTSSSRSRQYFDGNYINQLFRMHESGEAHHMRHINLLVAFELWHREFLPAGN